MDFLVERFEEIASQSFGGITVKLCEHTSCVLEAFVVSVTSLEKESLAQYCKFHRAWVLNRRKRDPTSDFRYVFVYDIRAASALPIADTIELMKQKIEMHKSLYTEYEQDLLCTVLIINSTHIKTIVNAILYLYTPCRPVRFVDKRADLFAFLSSTNAANGEMLADGGDAPS